MGYLYGDATPFPLDENFIETLTSLTEACAALFRAENASEVRRQEIADARSRASAEQGSLQELGQAVATALSPFLKSASKTAAGAAAQIQKAVQSTLQTSNEAVESRRDQVIRSASGVDDAGAVRKAAQPFFVGHQLPDTTWGAEWWIPAGRDTPSITVHGYGPEAIRLTFDGKTPASGMWKEAIRVSDHDPDLTITISKEPGLLGKSTRREGLHRMVVTRVHYTPPQFYFEVRHSAKKASAGYRIVMHEAGQTCPYLQRITADDQHEGSPEVLRGESASALRRFWEIVEQHASELPATRAELVSLQLGPKSAGECKQPQRLAETMLAVIAPIVHEMRKRSRVPGELGLKRQLGDGKREEIFVSREKLSQLFAGLPDHQARVFEAVGLAADSTQEFLGTMLPGPDQGGMDLDRALDTADVEPPSSRPARKSAPPPVPGQQSQSREVVIEAEDPDDEMTG